MSASIVRTHTMAALLASVWAACGDDMTSAASDAPSQPDDDAGSSDRDTNEQALPSKERLMHVADCLSTQELFQCEGLGVHALSRRFLRRMGREFRYRTYFAKLSATNMGERGIRVREQYQYVPAETPS